MTHPKAGRAREPMPVKYLAAVLAGRGFDFARLLAPPLEDRFGRIDYRGEAHQFAVTDYYESEMGPDLCRTIVSFEPLAGAASLVEAKAAAADIEKLFAEGECRRVNIDIGYMDFYKVVLASFKEGPQKIYLGGGVYADPVLMFQDGAFRPLEWSFPDFRAGVYTADLTAVRALLKASRRGGAPPVGTGGGRW